MRFVYSFLIIFVAASLFMFPFTEAIYDFRTDVREDDYSVDTTGGLVSANVTLLKDIYDHDYSTIGILSSISSDIPVLSTYNSTSRQLLVTGLTANTSRVIYVSYDIDALSDNGAISTFINITPILWYCFIVTLMAGGIISIFI